MRKLKIAQIGTNLNSHSNVIFESLKKQISAVGYKIVTDRGDIRKEEYYGNI